MSKPEPNLDKVTQEEFRTQFEGLWSWIAKRERPLWDWWSSVEEYAVIEGKKDFTRYMGGKRAYHTEAE